MYEYPVSECAQFTDVFAKGTGLPEPLEKDPSLPPGLPPSSPPVPVVQSWGHVEMLSLELHAPLLLQVLVIGQSFGQVVAVSPELQDPLLLQLVGALQSAQLDGSPESHDPSLSHATGVVESVKVPVRV